MAARGARGDTPKLTVASPAPPKGGGAISGMGERLASDGFSGGASLTIPIPFPVARDSAPPLALSYQSGGGNSAFGSGFDIGLPTIARQTSKRIPRYDGSDVFVHSLLGELVPVPGASGETIVAGVSYRTTAYRQRLESEFAAIEHWSGGGRDLWQVVDKDNVTWLFGADPVARLADPADPARVFSWMLQESYDARGNHILYAYKADSGLGGAAPAGQAEDAQGVNCYLSHIHWGNQLPLPPAISLSLSPSAIAAIDWHFHAVFDYGEYGTEGSNPYQPSGPWRGRADPFSHYAAGFNIRTERLCRTIMLFHQFVAELGPDPLLVTAIRLGYDENPYLTKLTQIAEVGFRTDPAIAGGARQADPMPPLELDYARFEQIGGSYRPITLAGGQAISEESFEWVDLFGVGLPGLLHAGADGIRFWEPSRIDPASATISYAGPIPVAPAPTGAQADAGPFTLADVTGAGRPQWLSRGAPCPGYAEIDLAGGAGALHPFLRVASDQDNPARQIVNVTGTGLPDLLLLAADRVEYTPSLGALGYGATQVVPPTGLPPALGDTPGDARRFADIFGSGQMHYVRVQNGAVTAWPNLGYGRFGAPVRLVNAPWLGTDFDPSRLFLVDLDGTGPADLVYLDASGLHYFRNRAGNGFDDAVALPLPEPPNALTRVDFADLLGAGVLCLIVTQPSPVWRQAYLPINGGVRPHMLTAITNNLGQSTSLAYGSSAQAWLADRNLGIAWLTVPPMSVPLLAQITARDFLSDITTIRRFAYRHGYYDAQEYAFTGFAFVEETDGEIFPEPAGAGQGASEAYRPPPSITRRWRHTGAAPGGRPLEQQLAADYFDGDAEQYAMPPSTAQFIERDGDSVAQARYAMRGQLLHEEVYGADGSRWASLPYSVDDDRYLVSQLQPSVNGQASVFFVRPLETISYQYERAPADPRVSHAFTLATDAYGNVTDSCTIAYPRRGAPGPVSAQAHLLAMRTQSSFLNVISPFRLLGVPSETIEAAITGLLPDAQGYLSLAALADQLKGAAATRYGWTRYSYAPDTGGAALAPQMLATSIETVAFDRTALETIFAPALDASALAALLTGPDAGYAAPLTGDAAGFWWNPGNSIAYADASGFYRPLRMTDPFGAVTMCRDDDYKLFLVSTVDALGNIVVSTIEYQALQPATIVDANGAVFEACFDGHQLVALTSVHGSEGDKATGFAPLSAYVWPTAPASVAAVLAAPTQYLQEAAAVYAYDLLAWCGRVPANAFAGLAVDPAGLWADLVARRYLTPEGAICARFRQDDRAGQFTLSPAYVAVAPQVATIISAAPHGSPVAALVLQATAFPGAAGQVLAATVAYTDGFGRILQTKTLADEAQPTVTKDIGGAFALVDSSANWLTSGAVRYNAKGDPMSQFEPFFSASSAFDPLEAANANSQRTTLWYDATGRLIQTETPLGTYLRTIYGLCGGDAMATPSAWDIAQFDANDTLKDSPYYQALMADPHADPYEKAAAAQAALANGSPARAVLDPLGRPVRTIRQNDGLVTQAGLETLSFDPANASALLADLIAAGYLDPRGAPTVSFTPGLAGWTLTLPAPFTGDADRIASYIAGVQAAGTLLTTDMVLDIQGNPLSIADQRLAAAGVTNATIAYSLANAPVMIASVDAGPRWQISNAAGQTIYTRDGNGNVVTTSYDLLQRVSTRTLVAAGSPICTTIALYGDSAHAAAPGGTLTPYFTAPETWNLRGQPVALFDPAGLILSPFATFQGFGLAHRSWVRVDAATLPDWTVADQTVLQALADAITALPNPAALTSLTLPPTLAARLDGNGYGGASASDALARRISTTDADGNVTSAKFNARGLISTLTFAPAGGAATTAVTPIVYDAHAKPRGYGVAGAFATQLDYDPKTFQLIGIETASAATPASADPVRQALRYYRDPVGNVMFALDSAVPPSGAPVGQQPVQAFAYDLLYRLITATGREATNGTTLAAYGEQYEYDDSGNATAVLHRGGRGDWSRDFTMATASNRLSAAAATGSAPANEQFTYDLNGNQTSLFGLDSISWSYLNRIARSTTTPDAQGAYLQEDHVYSGSGRRVRTVRQWLPGGGKPATRTEEITYVDALEINRVMNGPPGSATVEEWHVNRLAAGLLVPAQWQQWLQGTPASQPAAAMRYPLVDVVGSVRQLLDETGAPLTWREYLPYGGEAVAWAVSDTDAALQRRRFAGQEQDAAGELYGYAARHYAPQLMRWMSADPSGAADTVNLYQFVRSNPATFADADGRITIHHWNVENTTSAKMDDSRFAKEVASMLNGADDRSGSVVFLTEIMASATTAAFNTFLEKVNRHSSGGWSGRLLYTGKSEGGTRREKIAVLTKNVDVQSYFQLVSEHHTSRTTVKEAHPTGAFTKTHAFNERYIVGVDIGTQIGGATNTLSLGAYHNQGPSSGAPERAGRWRRQAANHQLHAVIGDWNVEPDLNQDRKRRRTRGSDSGETVTFDSTPTSRGGSLYDYALSFNARVGDRELTVRNRSKNRGASSDHRQNSATLTTRKRRRDD